MNTVNGPLTLEQWIDALRGTDDDAREELRPAAEALKAGAQLVCPGELCGTKEAAELLGVDRTTVSRWRADGYLPAPFQQLATGPVWLRSTLEAFSARHRERADSAGRRPVGTAAR